MIAGLLNMLAIWDAWGGPMIMPGPTDEDKNDAKDDESQKKKK
jgi:hypothetical protein